MQSEKSPLCSGVGGLWCLSHCRLDYFLDFGAWGRVVGVFPRIWLEYGLFWGVFFGAKIKSTLGILVD
jgi:hypothetical protein